jgi:forkhead box protein J1
MSLPGGETSDLTSLSWLHNLNIMDNISGTAAPPTPPASPVPISSTGSVIDAGRIDAGRAGLKDGAKNVSKRPNAAAAKEEEEVEIDYKVVGDTKPPYSYASLICMAMKANQHKMTLSAIYKWIKENFLFYRNADPSWQVSRHFPNFFGFHWPSFN